MPSLWFIVGYQHFSCVLLWLYETPVSRLDSFLKETNYLFLRNTVQLRIPRNPTTQSNVLVAVNENQSGSQINGK